MQEHINPSKFTACSELIEGLRFPATHGAGGGGGGVKKKTSLLL